MPENIYGISEKPLTILVAQVATAGVSDAVMDVDIRLAAGGVASEHKQVVYAGVAHTLYRSDNRFQELLVLESSKIINGFDVQCLQILRQLVAHLFFGDFGPTTKDLMVF